MSNNSLSLAEKKVEPRQTFCRASCEWEGARAISAQQNQLTVESWEINMLKNQLTKLSANFQVLSLWLFEFFEIFSERENSMNCVLNLPVILVETCFYFKQESID